MRREANIRRARTQVRTRIEFPPRSPPAEAEGFGLHPDTMSTIKDDNSAVIC